MKIFKIFVVAMMSLSLVACESLSEQANEKLATLVGTVAGGALAYKLSKNTGRDYSSVMSSVSNSLKSSSSSSSSGYSGNIAIPTLSKVANSSNDKECTKVIQTLNHEQERFSKNNRNKKLTADSTEFAGLCQTINTYVEVASRYCSTEIQDKLDNFRENFFRQLRSRTNSPTIRVYCSSSN